MNRILIAVLVLVFAFAGRTAMARTPWCSAEILAPGAGATFRTGGALTYPVYFSSHHVYLVNNPPPVLYLSVSGGRIFTATPPLSRTPICRLRCMSTTGPILPPPISICTAPSTSIWGATMGAQQVTFGTTWLRPLPPSRSFSAW